MTNTRKKPQKRTATGTKARKGSRRPRRRKKTPPVWVTLLKMAGALCILALIVTTVGVIAHFTLQHPEPPPTTAKHPPVVYEVYPKPAKPPAKTPAATRTNRVKPATEPALPAPIAKLPKVAIIIDDVGYDKRLANAFMDMNVPLTFSVLPQSPFLKSITRKLRDKEYEIMLHLPMEPIEYPEVNPGPGALLGAMSPDEIIAQLNRNIDSIPGIKGVNNHMGSRLTGASEKMYQVFTVLKKRKLYFVDSRSSPETVAKPSARLFQLPFAERDVFLDHFQDPDFIRGQFRELIREARQQGEAVGIAHPHPVTVQIFREELPELQKHVKLVPASEIVHVVP